VLGSGLELDGETIQLSAFGVTERDDARARRRAARAAGASGPS
jgi:hypothetical protein